MDHTFQPSFTDINKCNRCTFAKDLHGDNAQCEACPNTGNLNPCNGMALCRECIAKELSTSLPSVPVNEVTHGTLPSTVLDMSRNIDNSIRISTDLFNAGTVPILELKKAIDEDTSIPADKKHYVLAQRLLERFNIHKAAIFKLQAEIVIEHSSQRAIQQYLNTLATQLQKEEREKLKIADINYKPEEVKEPKPKVVKPKAQKFTNAEIKTACAQFGVDEFMVRMTMTAKSCSLLEAVHMIITAKNKALGNDKKTGTE